MSITDPELQLTRDTIAAIRAQLDTLDAALPADPPDPESEWPDELPSPTGQDPVLLWTPHWQATWYRMQTEFEGELAPPPSDPPDWPPYVDLEDPRAQEAIARDLAQYPNRGVETSLGATWYGVVCRNALGNRYADTGIWATLLFQATGDLRWKAEAWRKLQTGLLALQPTTGQLGGNGVREWGMEWVLVVHWLWPALSETERAQCLAQLDMVFTVGYAKPVRTTDSDQTVGVYFATAFYYLAFGSFHPPAVTFWTDPQVGGFAVTGDDRLTLRNAVADYMRLAAGGEWIESGAYNWGTMKLVLMGYYGCLTAHNGVDHFPEIAAWCETAKLRSTYMLTSDFADPLQWGDEEHPRGVALYKVQGLSMLFADPVTNDLVHTLVALNGATGAGSAEPALNGARGFLRFDPYGPRVSRTTLPLHWFAAGQGILSARTSWEADASHFFAHFPQDAECGYVDHTVNYHGDLMIYRKGAWALTHPLGYGGRPNIGEGTNGMLHQGWGSTLEFRSALTHQVWPDAHYLAGTVGGDVLPAKFYNPPPHWFHEWSRAVLWITGEPDLLIVFDRSHAQNPLELPKFTSYSVAHRAKMEAAFALRDSTWHIPVTPTISYAPLRVSWPDATITLLDEREILVRDVTTAWPPPPPVPAGTPSEPTILAERKWQVKALAHEATDFMTSLTVVMLGDATGVDVQVPPPTAGIRSVQLTRSGQPDLVAVFNVTPGPQTTPRIAANTWDPWNRTMLSSVRQCTAPVTVSWVAKGSSTELFLPERDRAVKRVSVSGSGPQTYASPSHP